MRAVLLSLLLLALVFYSEGKRTTTTTPAAESAEDDVDDQDADDSAETEIEKAGVAQSLKDVKGSDKQIYCYQCVSTSEQAGCAENDKESLKEYLKVCEPLDNGGQLVIQNGNKPLPAIGCRKIIQTVEGEESTVRECAYSGKVQDGLRKTGNWGIRTLTWQCVNQKDDKPCNSTPGLLSSSFLVLASLLFALFQ